jgi:hypothetical protein
MKPGTVLRPVGKFFNIRVTSCRFDLRTIRIEGDHLRGRHDGHWNKNGHEPCKTG